MFIMAPKFCQLNLLFDATSLDSVKKLKFDSYHFILHKLGNYVSFS